MENKDFNSFNSEVAIVVSIQVLDKVLRKEITHEEMNGILKDMRDKDNDFVNISGTFVNKKAIYFLEFQPMVNMKNAEVNK
jgi:hypothetical protein